MSLSDGVWVKPQQKVCGELVWRTLYSLVLNNQRKTFQVSLSIDNKDKDGPEQYHKLDEILITRKLREIRI